MRNVEFIISYLGLRRQLRQFRAILAAIYLFINSRTAIAGAIIGLLLVFFTTRRGVLVFLRFFLPEVLFVQTMF